MKSIFPEPIQNLPLADIPFENAVVRLFQGENQQIMFMEFASDVELKEHAHAAQWGIVLEGQIDLEIDGVKRTYTKGDRYFIPKGIKHSGKIYAGYTDITFFDEKNRYNPKVNPGK